MEQNENVLTEKQVSFLKILLKNANNISQSCEKAGISRQTHYDWLNNSREYKKSYSEIEEAMIDFVESHLMKSIKTGNVTAQIFFLKTKGKKRGYVERNEMEIKNSDEFSTKTDKEIEFELIREGLLKQDCSLYFSNEEKIELK